MEDRELPAVSVCLSSKDRPDLLERAVASLKQLDYPREKLEILVVEETDRPRDPGADRYLVLSREGRGFAWSRNVAWRSASHRLIAFTDDDCIVERGWLRELVAPFRETDVGAVSGGVLGQPSGDLGKTEIVLGLPGGGLRRIARNGDHWTDTRDVSTVNVAVRRDLLEELGGFREATGAYGAEDSELFARLTARHRAVFNPRALVYHRCRDSLGGIARWLHRRGLAAVALLRLSPDRRGELLADHLRGSLALRGLALLLVLAVARAAGASPSSLALAVLALAAFYYALLMHRYRYAREHFGLAVLALTPITRILMDVSFEIGRLHGLLLWALGRLPSEAAKTARTRVLLADGSAEWIGGGQVSFSLLAERLDRSRWEPIVALPEDGDLASSLEERGLPVVFCPTPSLRGFGALRFPSSLLRWIRLLRRLDVAIVHVNGSRAMMHAGVAAWLCARPVIWHVRVLGSDGFIDRALARMAARIVVNSQAVARRFEFLSSTSRRESLVVVPNGVDRDAHEKARLDSDLHRLQDLEGDLVLAVIAQLLPWKRHELAIETLAALTARGLRAKLLLIGGELPESRGHRARLEARAAALGVAADCVFTGFRRDVPALLRLADVLLHPARNEPFGRALIEAMASGLPVIAATGGGAGEVVEHDVTGFLLDSDSAEAWADAVETLAREPELRRRLGDAGRARVEERFSLERHVRRIEGLYQILLQSMAR